MKNMIALTDVETTGTHDHHEIVEIGLVVVRADNLEVVDTLNMKIKPTNIKEAEEGALRVNGYNEADWQDAVSLFEAMNLYVPKISGATFASYTSFDLRFVTNAAQKTGHTLGLTGNAIDIWKLAKAKIAKGTIPKYSLLEVCKFFGIAEEPLPHRAINGAYKALEVYKKLLTM